MGCRLGRSSDACGSCVGCSGFAAGVDSRLVLQVRLRCTEGRVRWIYPGQALRVELQPNLSSSPCSTICIQPDPSLSGASLFLERAGQLQPLRPPDGGWTRRKVLCFRAEGPHRPAIYLQSSPQREGAWSRHTLGFRYELRSNRSDAPSLQGPTGTNSEFIISGLLILFTDVSSCCDLALNLQLHFRLCKFARLKTQFKELIKKEQIIIVQFRKIQVKMMLQYRLWEYWLSHNWFRIGTEHWSNLRKPKEKKSVFKDLKYSGQINRFQSQGAAIPKALLPLVSGTSSSIWLADLSALIL